jgi:hypothetical protein
VAESLKIFLIGVFGGDLTSDSIFFTIDFLGIGGSSFFFGKEGYEM